MDSRVSFIKGRMNKSYDQRLLPEGEYIDAMNIRLGSTEDNSVGVIENTKGNIALTQLQYNGAPLSTNALCIGAYEAGDLETIFWFVTDPGNVDMIVSYNTDTNSLLYHVISETVLNFNSQYIITGINLIDKFLFWTDNLNPPRKINLRRTYMPPVGGVDSITDKDINVIVAPPLEAPIVQMINLSGGENFIEDTFISFSYRYKYKDNEYSALSQFTEVAFEPGSFRLDYSTFDNAAMFNIFNGANVKFNTGSSNVLGIDLCFKFSNSNIVNVVEKYIKTEQGWGNNQIVNVVFDNRKIYTTLPESELLRLYDNVPHVAKAQTTMGNRIMYGNYIDGYDIHDSNDKPIAINYNVALLSEDISNRGLTTSAINGSYNIQGTSVPIDYCVYSIDFGPSPSLTEGSSILIDFNLQHDIFSGPGATLYSTGTDTPLNQFSHQVLFNLQQDYLNVAALAASQEFQEAISNPKPLIDCATGFSLSDFFNCEMLVKPDWEKYTSGVNNPAEGFLIIPPTGSGTVVQIQIPAMAFKNIADPTLIAYEYFQNANTLASISSSGSKRSLHSNRDYEVGIVYMDEYNRSSTALVCNTNTIFIPASKSVYKNTLFASINSKPPYWATKYKWVIKPSKTDYQTVYSYLYFQDAPNLCTWFYIEGDNRSKVKENDIVIVKSDSNGPLTNLVKAKVLGLEYKMQGDLGDGVSPEGSYMKIKPSGFTVKYDQATYISLGSEGGGVTSYINVSRTNPDTSAIEDIPIKAGSKVTIKIDLHRDGTKWEPHSCGDISYLYERTFTASNDYYNFYEYINGDGINLTNGSQFGGDDTANSITTQYNPSLFLSSSPTDTATFYNELRNAPFTYNKLRFMRDLTTDKLYFAVASAARYCSGKSSYSNMSITIQDPNGLIVFETQPADSDGEKFYEGSGNFDIINGLHQGSSFPDTENGSPVDHNQTSTTPAVCRLEFFNCFTFGNGVESYKIGDSLTGAPLYLGTRVNAVSQQEYKQTLRYASITYSGVYNAESNVNKLNEFNLGLANYKDLQKSFGPIQVLFSRATDILTLQEDKISYVLQGKNLLSDAAAGGAITSIPEVLGTQIARIENFGISHNAESFTSWGSEMVWTDAKRSSVLKLTGGSYTSDQLDVISDINMKVWFRDLFKNSFKTQKLMAYDPYMDEFVLSSNDRLVIVTQTEQPCGLTFSQLNSNDIVEYDLDLGEVMGNVDFNYNLTDGLAILVVEYDGETVIDSRMIGEGTLSFNKTSPLITSAHVTITPVDATYSFTSTCPDNFPVTLYRVVVNNVSDSNKTIHNSYNWAQGAFTSNTLTDNIVFESDGVSLFASQSGMSSEGTLPSEGSQINMSSQKISGDTYDFQNNTFRYLVSDTAYTESQINDILNSSTQITPITSPSNGLYTVNFTYSNPTELPYVYLIWDYRNSANAIDLCYSDISAEDVCCNCDVPPIICKQFTSFNIKSPGLRTLNYVDCWGVNQTITVTVPSSTTPGDLPYYEFENPICVQDGSVTVAGSGGGPFYPYYADNAACDTSTGLVQSILCGSGSIYPTGCSAICEGDGDSPRVYISNSTTGVLNNGDIICNTNNIVDVLEGGDYYYMIEFNDIQYGVRVNNSGIISELTYC